MRGALVIALVAALSACSAKSDDASTTRGAPTYAEQGCDDAGFDRVRRSVAGGAEVTICGRVASVRGDVRTRSGLHKHWRVDAGDRHDTVEIDSNEDLEGVFDVAAGEYVVVRGEYYADPNGRDGIHYTHRDPRGRHDAGFVFAAGRLYQ